MMIHWLIVIWDEMNTTCILIAYTKSIDDEESTE